MIYAVDTCVLLDVLLPDPVHGVSSKDVLNKAAKDGKLVICPIVYAELSPEFKTQDSFDIFLKETGIEILPFSREILWKGGEVWKAYTQKGGKRKDRIIPDFLIGAFSSVKAEAIITRDRDFYKTYFHLDAVTP